MARTRDRSWFPFQAREVELVLGVFAFLTACLTFIGADNRALAWVALAFVLFSYLAGLLVHARQERFTFIREGAVRGSAYAPYFRRATKSLLLVHADDDAPSEELLGIYRVLLERGVELRRVIFLQPDHARGAYDWIVKFGEHARLKQRVVLPQEAGVMRMSFVVVDDQRAMFSVPGDAAVDGEEYSGNFVLRHLLVVKDREVAEAITEAHSQLWRRAAVLEDVSSLADPAQLSERLRGRRRKQPT
jgi:hypothetical protein